MNVELAGATLRALHRSVAFLSRVGAETLIEARDEGNERAVVLRAVNVNRSAFARVRVSARAFERFTVVGGRARACALAKHVLASLRGAVRAERCVMSTETREDGARRVTVRTTSAKSGTTRTYEMCEVVDAEHVDAEMDAEGMPGKVVVRARAMGALLAHFATSAREDVTIAFARVEATSAEDVDEERRGAGKILTLSSYASAGAGLSQALQTSVSVRRDDESILFYRNDAGAKIEVTVNLKDLRGAVQLCESSDVDVALYCAQAGAPVIVKPTADFKFAQQHGDGHHQPPQNYTPPPADFEAELVLASMLPPEPTREEPPTQSRRDDERAAAASAPQPLPNAPLGSQPWSGVPDTEDGSQRDAGGVEVASAPRREPAATIPSARLDEDDWFETNGDEFVEATPPEKRRRS